MAANCNVGLSNTGTACTPIIRVQKQIILVPTYDNTGVANEIDLTVTFDAAFFAARVNDVDPSKRWYPLPAMKSIEDTREASLMEDFPDMTKVFISQGVRSFTGLVIADDAPPVLVQKIRDARGTPVSVFIIDKDLNLIGKKGSLSTTMAPIGIEQSTIDATFVKTIDKAIQKIAVKFDFGVTENDANLIMIQSSEMVTPLTLLKGLVNVTSVITGQTTTGFVLKLVTEGGTPITPVLVKNLVITDFVSSITAAAGKLRNVTTAADITITTVTEAPAGVYTFVTPNETGDLVTIKPKKNGFDFTAVSATPILYP